MHVLKRFGWIALVSLLSVWLSTKLTISSDLSALFPDRGAASTLSRVARVFGGGDLALALVEGDDPAEVEAATRDLARALEKEPAVTAVIQRAPRETDPMLAWAYAGPRARERLADALTPEGMRRRLAGSKELLLGPGAAAIEPMLARDPLRLALIPWEDRAEIAAGAQMSEDGTFVADRGRARLVALEAKGHAFESASAHAFVASFERARATALASHPTVRASLAGGHAVAVATEAMIRRDMYLSGTLSMVLVTIAFLFLFPRRRAVLAILPPVALGGFWTASIGALFAHGLSAVSIGFAAVVVGVGIDTGVHVYAAVQDARRLGLSTFEAADRARRTTARPVILAALAAGACFGALVISELTAMRELGILCGAGEVLTSVAILGVTPELAALLERSPVAPKATARWTRFIDRATATKRRAALLLAAALAPAILLAALGGPKVGAAIIALRPKSLAPLDVQARIYQLFGGQAGQWIVVTHNADALRAQGEAGVIAEELDRLEGEGVIDGYDSVARFDPPKETLIMRVAAREQLHLSERRADLEAALREEGFDPSAFGEALAAMEHPNSNVAPPPAWVGARYVGQDAGETLVVTYVRPKDEKRLVAALRGVDPDAIITGWPLLEDALKDSLAHDLPRVAVIALLIVGLALGASLRTTRDVIIAIATLLIAIVFVLFAMRVIGVSWHVYDALVLPVLLGITMDEAMFLLYAARGGSGSVALDEQGPLVACTALTTAAGFGALAFCRFDGLRDVGVLGAAGSVAGLFAALFVVPAALRLFPTDARSE